MRKFTGIIAAAYFALILISGCEPMSYKEFSMPEYDGLFTWTRITKKAEWSNRVDLAGVAFDNKLWILGGYDSGRLKGDTYLEDVWSSTDGENWILETDNAPWKGRRGHTVNVFNDGSGEAMYLIGGFEVDEETGHRQYTNDVWKSVDGVNWEQIKARDYSAEDNSSTSWFPRSNHACIDVIQNDTNYLYLIGGQMMREKYNPIYSMKYFNDVWRSKDAIQWEKIECNDFGERSELAAFSDPETGRLYIHGGVHSMHFDQNNDELHPVLDYYCIWSSNDGLFWEVDTSFTLSRAGHEMFMFDDFFWIFPGKTTSYKKFHMAWSNLHYTYRKAIDGEWILDSEGSAFSGRHSYARIILNNKVYVMGGETGDNGLNNDVWCGELNN